MGAKFVNNKRSTLAAGIASGVLELTVSVGTGATFPAAGTGNYFMATLFDSNGNREIIKVTAKSSDTFTIERAQEGTSARAWLLGDGIAHRVTAGQIQDLQDNLDAVVTESAASTLAVAAAESDIDALEATVDTPTTGLSARMTAAEGAATTLAGRVTTVENDLNTAEATLASTVSTVGGHTTTIGSHTTSIASNTSNITSQGTRLTTVENKEKTKSVSMCIFESDELIVVGNGTIGFLVPAEMASHNLTAARAACHTQGSSGTTDVQIRRRRAGSDADMLSTKITMGAEYHAADGVINTSYDDITTGDLLFPDVDAARVGSYGLVIVLTFTEV